MRMLEDDESNDVEVSWADQQKINGFSRLNSRQAEAQEELEALRTEKEQVDEVFEEVQLMEMSEDFDDGLGASDEEGDDEEGEGARKGGAKAAGNEIPFKIGDAFIHVSLERATELLEEEQRRLDDAISAAQQEVDRCDGEMKKLKVDLYAKFGTNISELTSIKLTGSDD